MEATNQDQLREMVSLCSKQAINDLKPDELVLVDSWIDKYLASEISKKEITQQVSKEPEAIFGIGSPELWSAIIIPLVTTIVKDMIIPRLPKNDQKLSKTSISEIRTDLHERQEYYEAVIKVKFRNKRDAKRIMRTLITAILTVLKQ